MVASPARSAASRWRARARDTSLGRTRCWAAALARSSSRAWRPVGEPLLGFPEPVTGPWAARPAAPPQQRRAAGLRVEGHGLHPPGPVKVVFMRVLLAGGGWRWPGGPARIGPILGLPASTVHRVLTRHRLNRLAWLDRPTGTVIRRYERQRPGELIPVHGAPTTSTRRPTTTTRTTTVRFPSRAATCATGRPEQTRSTRSRRPPPDRRGRRPGHHLDHPAQGRPPVTPRPHPAGARARFGRDSTAVRRAPRGRRTGTWSGGAPIPATAACPSAWPTSAPSRPLPSGAPSSVVDTGRA